MGLLDSGTAESGSASTLVDTDKSWTTNIYQNKFVKITGGTGKEQVRKISSNSSNTLTIIPDFDTNPDATSDYEIRDEPIVTPRIEIWDTGTGLVSSIDLGKIEDETTSIVTGATVLPLPLEDSSNAQGYDFQGRVKKINARGRKQDTFGNVINWINDEFEDAIDVQQLNTSRYLKYFSNKYYSGINMLLIDAETTFRKGVPTKVEWQINIARGTKL